MKLGKLQRLCPLHQLNASLGCLQPAAIVMKRCRIMGRDILYTARMSGHHQFL